MLLKKEVELKCFLDEVRLCIGDVYFETKEGDSLSLKSTLCQFIFCTLSDRPDILYTGHIRFERSEDEKILDRFLRF